MKITDLKNPQNSKCSHLERYTCNSPVATENEVIDLLVGFVRALQPDYVLEVGAHEGDATVAIAKALRQNGQGAIYAYERIPQKAERIASRISSYQNQARVFASDYKNAHFAPPMYDDMRPPPLGFTGFDFCFFDSQRDKRDQEFIHFHKWIKKGAIVAFHDTGDQSPSRSLVEKLEAQRLVKALYLETPRGIAIGQVI